MLVKQIGLLMMLGYGYYNTPTSNFETVKLESPVRLIKSTNSQKKPLVEVSSYKLIYDGDFKPRYKVQIVNHSKLSVIGYRLSISLVNRKTKASTCEFYLKKKQTILYNKTVSISGDIPEFKQICDYDNISVMLTGVVFSDGTKMDGIQLLLSQYKK